MNILLSGSNGILGSSFLSVSNEFNFSISTFDYHLAFCLTREALIDLISDCDIFIHSAANTNVEYCEENPNDCYKDNYLLTEILSNASRLANVPFVYISSTGVYGNYKHEPYREYDHSSPTTHHHMSKFLAEKIVLQTSPSNLVIRTGWLFGGKMENKKNFIARRLDEAKSAMLTNNTIYSNHDQRGVPCYAEDVSKRVFLLIKNNAQGLFNCVNEGNASRFEYVREIINISKINVQVLPTSASSFNRLARVSNNEMATNWKMTNLKYPEMPNWIDGLSRYISKVQF